MWAYVGLNSFGGPTGQIAVMHRVLVEEKRWVREDRFLHALNYCMLLPGPEAMQLATYVGWLMHRTLGGLIAGVLFVLPGFVSILALSVAATALGDVPAVQGLIFGMKAAVLALVVEAMVRIGRRVLRNGAMLAVAAGSFVAIYVYAVPFPVIIAAAAVLGFAGDRVRPDLFEVIAFKEAKSGAEGIEYATDWADLTHTHPSAGRTIGTLCVWLVVWLGPVAGLVAWLGRENVFAAQAVFFSQSAVVTFGGAYAVLAYIAQQAVDVYGWLEAGEMLTGLGFAETTPGPLIQVVQYVGYMGAYREPGGLHPVLAGSLASVVVTWVTFAPCFLWIFVGGPYVELVRGVRALRAALSAITAAVCGVILNLAVWLGAQTLFGEVREVGVAGGRVMVPVLVSVSWGAVVIALVSGVLLMRVHWGALRTLLVAVVLGVVWVVIVS